MTDSFDLSSLRPGARIAKYTTRKAAPIVNPTLQLNRLPLSVAELCKWHAVYGVPHSKCITKHTQGQFSCKGGFWSYDALEAACFFLGSLFWRDKIRATDAPVPYSKITTFVAVSRGEISWIEVLGSEHKVKQALKNVGRVYGVTKILGDPYNLQQSHINFIMELSQCSNKDAVEWLEDAAYLDVYQGKICYERELFRKYFEVTTSISLCTFEPQ